MVHMYRTFDEALRETLQCKLGEHGARGRWGEREKKQRKSVTNLINSNLTFYRTRLFEW